MEDQNNNSAEDNKESIVKSSAEDNKKNIIKTITHCYKEVSDYSARLSSIFRQLAFSEGLLFWFAYEKLSAPILLLIIGFTLLIIYFILDLVQYFFGLRHFENLATTFNRDYKNNILDLKNYEIKLPSSLDLFFYFKMVIMCLASIILIFSFVLGLMHQSCQ